MARIDVKDKDPFAHADDEPKDNISTGELHSSTLFCLVLHNQQKFLKLH